MKKPVALVLGAAVRPNGAPSAALERRVRHAVRLWHEGQVQALVLSGGVRTHPPSEADVMARLCREEGVPEAAVHCENAALTTEDNIRHALPLLKRLDAREVVLVTDRYHAARALLVARRAGLKVRMSCPNLGDASLWRVARAWLREAVALAWYWARGSGR